jgi:hypothetical protein
MENFTEEEVKSLTKLSEINTARIEGYENAISKVCKGGMKTFFGEKVKETLDLTQQINQFIGDFEIDEFENHKIQRSNFYFTIAKASDNPRTVILSCQLGDECAVTAYKDILLSKTVKLLPYLREILQKQLSNLEECLTATHQILFDSAFA